MFRLALVIALLPGLGGAEYKSVSAQDARRLARAALPEWALKAGPVYIDQGRFDPDTGFYFFTATRSNPGGSGTVGHFAIHGITGDVWDGVVCQEYKTEAIARLQTSIRRKLGLTEAAYQKLRRQGPYCDALK